MTLSRPLLSVIVPAHQAARLLPDTLQALVSSDLPREWWELIVVDDASRDGTDVVASQFADTVVRLAGNPHGPAYSRNRAYEFSRGHVLVFVDADVRVHPDSLRLIAMQFLKNPELGAVFGAYDDAPAAAGVVSEYRNLLHHYVHRNNAGDAETFWAGLGAIRRDVFAEAGTFDEWHYPRPLIEDIELGRRIRRIRRRIVLRPEIQGTHLKRWTLTNVLNSDYAHRGVPWAWLMIQEGPAPDDQPLNLQLKYKLSTVAAWLAVIALATTPVIGFRLALAIFGVLFAVVFGLNQGFYRVLIKRMGVIRALACIPIHFIHHMSNGVAMISAWFVYHLVGEPQAPAAFAAMSDTGLKMWPPVHSRPRASIWKTPPYSTASIDERSSDRPRKEVI